MFFSCLLIGEVSTPYLMLIKCMLRFLLYVSWFHSQGVWIGSVICKGIMGDSSCFLGRPSLIRVCWVSFGA